jgi:hypothetical protein
MSEITRKGLELLFNKIGNAKFLFSNEIGDVSKNRTALLNLEKLVIKLRGSTNFHDYDIAQKDPITGLSTLPTYDTLDSVKFGIQGGEIVLDPKISNFPNTSTFSPNTYSPPSLEGWGIYDYNAWSNYIPQYTSSGLANTNYVIYGSEPSSGAARTTYSYPVKYSSGYTRVPLFNSAKYFSFKNDSDAISENEIHVVFPKTYLDGVYQINPLTNTPIDVGIYSHPNLFSSLIPGNLVGVINNGESLSQLAYSVSETNKAGSATSTIRDHYQYKIKLPSGFTWTENYWCHIIFYYGTHDTYFLSAYPTYSAGVANTYNYNNVNSNWNSYSKKSFFRKDFNSYLTFDKTGIKDTNVYLYSADKTHHRFIDGEYAEPVDPLRYKLNETITGASLGDNNSLNAFQTIDKFEFIAVILATKNTGTLYESPVDNITVYYSSPIPYEYLDSDWANFDYYPQIPDDYDVICKIILQYPDIDSSQTCKFIDSTVKIINNCSIVFIDQVADNFIKQSLGDEDVMKYLYSPFYKILNDMRFISNNNVFDIVAYSVIPYGSRFNVNNFRDISQFSDDTLNYYKLLHNLIKRPIDSLLQNTANAEPKALQLSEQARIQTKDWSILEPSTNVASLLSNNLSLSDVNLSVDSEFEIYQEQSYLCEAVDPNLAGNKVGQDYTFRIKFQTTKENYLFKDLFVNSSKYFLTDKEYQDRIDNDLSVVGYYKQDTLSNIDAYRLYGYAGVIPDLKMEDSRPILTKVVNPVDSTITSEDYVPDLNQYSNKFSTIKDIGVCVSQYTNSSNKYWLNNSNSVVGCSNIANVIDPEAISDIVADSFTIASTGYNTTDGSISNIENICLQKNTVNLASTLNQLSFNGYQDIIENQTAIKIVPSVNTSIKSFIVKLRKTTNDKNPYAYVQCQIWSNSGGLPSVKLATGSKTYLDNITYTVKDYEFDLFYDLIAGNTYWIVLEINKYPDVYVSNTPGLATAAGTSVSGIYDFTLRTGTAFTNYNPNSEIGFGSTNPTLISTWYNIASIGSTNFMTLSGTGVTLSSQNYVIKNKIQIGIQESSIIISTPNNLAKNTYANGWVNVQGTPYIKFFIPTLEVLGVFNRTIDGYDTMLAPPNKLREDLPNYQVDGYWAYTCKKLETPTVLKIYPRAVYLSAKSIITSGISGNSFVLIGKDDLPANIYVGEKIQDNDGNSYIPINSTITSITFNSGTQEYTINISTNITANFTNKTLTIGENKYIYVKRSNDIHLYVRYYQEGSLVTKYILLNKSASWNTKWFKKNSINYSIIDQTITEDENITTDKINFSDYVVSGQSEYINGVITGKFTPNSSLIGNTYTFKIEASGGFRLYLNGSETPETAFNKWTNSSLTSTTGSITVLDSMEFKIEFWHTTGSQKLSFMFNNGSGYKEMNTIFYTNPEPDSVEIDAKPIEKLAYLVIGKTLSEIDTPTHGAPPGDRLVFRNK